MHNDEHNRLMQSVAEKSLHLFTELSQAPVEFSAVIDQYTSLTNDMQRLVKVMYQNPEQIIKMQTHYWTDTFRLMQEQCNSWLQGKPLPIEDKRFAGQYWLNNPFFNMLSQHYLTASKHIQTLLETMQYEDKSVARQIQFFVNQYLDALSPSNFIATNPELIAETMQSQGLNVLKGLNNLLNDIDSNSGMLNVAMTNKNAFMLGENVAITPGKVIFKNEMMELIQYTPQTNKVYSIPLLMIPPWINKYYILDLSPENSLINWAVSQGMTVFVISWVNPDANYSQKTLFDYMQSGPITAIEKIKQQMQVEKVNSLGFCLGGTLQAMLLAYNKAIGDESINSAAFLASLIDFSEPGDIAVFIDEQQINKLEKDMNKKGYLAGKFMASSFNALRANDLIWSFFIKNYLQGKESVPFDILYWNSDSTNMPAVMHSQYLRWMYLQNRLIIPGAIELNGVAIDVNEIDIPTFFLSTQKDHIAPWKTTWLGFERMQGEKKFVLGGSGHIAGIINPPAANKYGYYVNDHYDTTPDNWLASAQHHEGSWWPEWMKWLRKYSGKKMAAPVWKSLPLKPKEDAPGTYVKVKPD